jgi:uncharacterized protein (TIGR03382 family)
LQGEEDVEYDDVFTADKTKFAVGASALAVLVLAFVFRRRKQRKNNKVLKGVDLPLHEN